MVNKNLCDGSTVTRVANIFEESRIGGPQIYILRVAQKLQGTVDMVVVAPEDNANTLRTRCFEADLELHTLKLSRITKDWKVALRYIFYFPIEIASLVRLLRAGDYQAVYVCGGAWQYKGAIAGKIAGKNVIWHLNDTSLPWLFRMLFRGLSGLADGYVFASHKSKSYYGNLIARRKPQWVIQAPVDTQQFNSNQDFGEEKELLAKWDGKFVVGTVANVNRIKGIDTLIKAASELDVQSENVIFVVIGPIYDSQRAFYKKLCDLMGKLHVNNVEFVGGRADVRPLLNRLDTYVCSSRFESSPISVWEAMSMGLPVVSTDVGDVPRFVKNKHNGYVVPEGDYRALAERVSYLMENADKRVEYGRRSRAIAVRELDVAKCAQAHCEMFESLIGGGGERMRDNC